MQTSDDNDNSAIFYQGIEKVHKPFPSPRWSPLQGPFSLFIHTRTKDKVACARAKLPAG